jgi:hypothetical protein
MKQFVERIQCLLEAIVEVAEPMKIYVSHQAGNNIKDMWLSFANAVFARAVVI